MDEQQRKLAEELLFSEKKQPSFVKKLFFGECESAMVVPYPYLSAQEKDEIDPYLEEVQAFIQQNIDGDAIDREENIPKSVIQGLGKLGVLGMTIPKRYGGLGMPQYAYCRVSEMLGGRCGATALFVNAHQSIGLKALLLFGTEEQKQTWLPALAKGERIAAFSLTEPNAGSDASGVETTAVYNHEKKCYILNGTKQWTTNGSIAGVLTVMAQTEVETSSGKQNKITAFLVTPDMPGFEVTAQALEKVGMRGSKTANLAFNNLEVPVKNILGPLGGGLKVCLTSLDYGRTTFGATCTGAAKFALNHATEYVKTRYQFHRPLSSFGLVKEKIAKMTALTYAMDATTYLTAGFVDKEVEDFMLEAAILKVFASDALWSILYDTMQIYGGRSFFTDQPFERMMRDARLNMIGEGSNEVLRAFIGVVGMRDVGIHYKEIQEGILNERLDFSTLKTVGDIGLKWFKQPKFALKSDLLHKETEQLGIAIRNFGRAVARLLYEYREDILEKQLALNRIATSAIAIYTCAAVLSKIDTDYQRTNYQVGGLGNDLQIAKLYCHMALRKIEQALDQIFDPQDSEIEHLSDLITKAEM